MEEIERPYSSKPPEKVGINQPKAPVNAIKRHRGGHWPTKVTLGRQRGILLTGLKRRVDQLKSAFTLENRRKDRKRVLP
jgi:hypothetical protein